MLSVQVEAIGKAMRGARERGLPIPIEDALLLRTLVIVGRALAQLADEAIRPSGLADGEFRVLMQLFSQREGIGHPSELCVGADQSPANITRITDALVARGLISRMPSAQDRRRTILQVTPEGEALIRSLPEAFAACQQLFLMLSAEERAGLRVHLSRVVQAYDQLQADRAK